jgi:hypothetical protein
LVKDAGNDGFVVNLKRPIRKVGEKALLWVPWTKGQPRKGVVNVQAFGPQASGQEKRSGPFGRAVSAAQPLARGRLLDVLRRPDHLFVGNEKEVPGGESEPVVGQPVVENWAREVGVIGEGENRRNTTWKPFRQLQNVHFLPIVLGFSGGFFGGWSGPLVECLQTEPRRHFAVTVTLPSFWILHYGQI